MKRLVLVCSSGTSQDFTMSVLRDSPDWYAAWAARLRAFSFDVRSDATSVVFGCGENGSGQCGRSMHQQQQALRVAFF